MDNIMERFKPLPRNKRPVSETVNVSRKSTYFSKGTCALIKASGDWVEMRVDSETQSILLVPHTEPGPGRFLVSNPEGCSIRTRSRVEDGGLDLGTYLRIEGMIFQHIRHIEV